MATISRFPFVRHLRADSNQHILVYSRGRVVRRGTGIAFFFNPLGVAVAQVPVEDCEAGFILRERSADFQEVVLQGTITYRFSDHVQAASRLNFSVSLAHGAWLEPPLERLANFWSQKIQTPARDYLVSVPLEEALRSGANNCRAAIETALRTDPEIEAMGLEVVSVQITAVSPSAEMEKAFQTPTREAVQQRADEAVFSRRALAVEKERAIKENELATEVELARRQDELIQKQGQNRLREVEMEAGAEMARLDAQVRRDTLAATAAAEQLLVKSRADADARRLRDEAAAEGERRRVEIYAAAPERVALGLALQQLAGKIETIQHLNLTPDLLGASLQQLLRDQAGK